MNHIDFLKYNQFPTSAETFEALQSMINLIARVASLGGANYILDGCNESGNNVSPGTVVLNGEILPFQGGPKSTYVVISETKDSVQVYDNVYTDLYISRKVIFGTGTGQLAWSGFKRFTDLLTLANNIAILNNAFSLHVNNHTVTWGNVQQRPTVYPPANHSHAYSDLSGIPLTGAYLGEFNAAGTVVTKISGSLNVTVTWVATGKYSLVHNIGHQRYIVQGIGLGDTGISLRSMNNIQNNSCTVMMADEGVAKNWPARFTILIF